MFNYLGNYPENRENGWSNDLQGVCHDDNNWYFTNGSGYGNLWKFPITHRLNEKMSWTFPSNCIVKYPGYEKKSEYKKAKLSFHKTNYKDGSILSFRDDVHYGDIDYCNGYIFVPTYKDSDYIGDDLNNPSIWVFEASTLEFVCSQELKKGTQGDFDGLGWCAINPQDGKLYTSDSRYNYGEYGDRTSPIMIFSIKWENIKKNGTNFLEYAGDLTLYNSDSTKFDEKSSMQGGCFDPYGHIYLMNGYCDGHRANDGITVFKMQEVENLKKELLNFRQKVLRSAYLNWLDKGCPKQNKSQQDEDYMRAYRYEIETIIKKHRTFDNEIFQKDIINFESRVLKRAYFIWINKHWKTQSAKERDRDYFTAFNTEFEILVNKHLLQEKATKVAQSIESGKGFLYEIDHGTNIYLPHGFLEFFYKWEKTNTVAQEPEGLTYWDLKNRTDVEKDLKGCLHAMLIENDIKDDDDFYFKHYEWLECPTITKRIVYNPNDITLRGFPIGDLYEFYNEDDTIKQCGSNYSDMEYIIKNFTERVIIGVCERNTTENNYEFEYWTGKINANKLIVKNCEIVEYKIDDIKVSKEGTDNIYVITIKNKKFYARNYEDFVAILSILIKYKKINTIYSGINNRYKLQWFE